MPSNPFTNNPDITEENYLSIRIERIKDKSRPDALNHAIDTLLQVKRVLDVVNKIGRLNEVGNRVYYQQAIQWLNSQIALGTFVSVPQITSLDAIDENTAALFDQYVTAFVTNIRTEQLYSQVEVMTAVAKVASTQKVEAREEEILGDFEEKANDILAATDNTLIEKQTTATEGIDKHVGRIKAELTTERNNSSEEIKTQLESAISQFQQAQALEDWGGVYDRDIADYEQKLFGRQWVKSTYGRDARTIKRNTKKKEQKKDRRKALRARRRKGIANTVRFLWSKATSFRAKRTFWFWLLFIFVIGFFLVTFTSALGHTHIAWIPIPDFFGSVNADKWYLKLVIYIPPVVLLSIAYSFAVKNFRIYSNMLDQYRHRRTVAQTAQGIIMSLKPEEDVAVRTQMTTAAAVALFQMRNTGHLTKKEAETMSLLDLFRSGSSN